MLRGQVSFLLGRGAVLRICHLLKESGQYLHSLSLSVVQIHIHKPPLYLFRQGDQETPENAKDVWGDRAGHPPPFKK